MKTFDDVTRFMYYEICVHASSRNGKIKYEKEIKELATDILFRYSSTQRFDFFYELSRKMSPKVYWELLGTTYTSSDNLFQYKEKVRECFAAKHPFKEYLMNDEERAFIEALPDEVTIYRGMTIKELESGKYGISWTLDKKVAEFFTDTYLRNHATSKEAKTIKELQIKKTDIVAYFQDRQESEIIYLG